MSMYEGVGSAMHLGRTGLVVTRVPAYSTIGGFLGLSLATAVILAAGALLVVGLASLATTKKSQTKS